ncbi:hypothetical protein pipiens_011906 [Culex pipiens pipiens]|uniref:Uncharacterized protein n=1 Tax=Culex pipiens pipiens TaxID=38569 RepID=A0ABD1D4E9_CULPP
MFYFEPSQSSQEGRMNYVTPELLQHILSVLSHGKLREFGLDVRALCAAAVPGLSAGASVIANSQSLLRSPVMDTAWGSLVMEIGYTFTASLEDCKNHLPRVGGRKNTAQDVAKIISSMCLTHASLSAATTATGNAAPASKPESTLYRFCAGETKISSALTSVDISHKVDDSSGSISRQTSWLGLIYDRRCFRQAGRRGPAKERWTSG